VKFSSLLKDIIYKDHDLDVLMEEIAKSEGEVGPNPKVIREPLSFAIR